MDFEVLDLAAAVRRAFRALAAAEAWHGAPGLTVPMRAVLEALGDGRAVPDVAAGLSVSRQHVQQTVNALYAAGLAEPRGNRRHRRSHLATPTPRGRETLAGLRRREAELLAEPAAALGPERLAAAAATLEALSELLERRADRAAGGAA